MIEEQEYKEIPLKAIGKNIVWILLMIVLFLFYEAMAREFSFFDEFSVFAVLLVIAVKLNQQSDPMIKKRSLALLAKMKQVVLKNKDQELALAYDEVMTSLALHPEE